ncbi:biotin/lipoate A/B protein ligase family protein [Trichinella spiralis]|nr:biotin/lipoate A/B protein ligase family protein [Trichinella spiralis]
MRITRYFLNFKKPSNKYLNYEYISNSMISSYFELKASQYTSTDGPY